MPSILTHTFVSAWPTGRQVDPITDWNGPHVFAGGNTGDLLVRDPTDLVNGAAWKPSSAALTFAGQTIGDLLFASAATAFARLPDVVVGSVLVSGGVGAPPAWSASPALTSVNITTGQKYGFSTGSAGFVYTAGAAVQLLASDGGAYFTLVPSIIQHNSCATHFSNGGTAMWIIAAPSVTGQAVFTNGAASAGIGLDFATDGTLKIRTRAHTGDAQVSAASVRGTAVAFASVPATPVEGMLVGVTDSNTAAWGANIAGGGANHVLAYYNGTNWTVAGK